MSFSKEEVTNTTAATQAQLPAVSTNFNYSQSLYYASSPAIMAHQWTGNEDGNREFYRVCHPKQITGYDTRNGLTAANQHLILKSRENNPLFLSLIRKHRNQICGNFLSLFISVFEDREEAEQWLMAAEEVFGKGTILLTINGGDKNLAQTSRWRVGDIERRMGQTFGGSSGQSEWLFLHHIPATAVVDTRSAAEVTNERGTKISRFDAMFPHNPSQNPGVYPEISLDPDYPARQGMSQADLIDHFNKSYEVQMPNYECGCQYGSLCDHLLVGMKNGF